MSLTDEISYFIVFRKGKMLQIVSSAAVEIYALRSNSSTFFFNIRANLVLASLYPNM